MINQFVVREEYVVFSLSLARNDGCDVQFTVWKTAKNTIQQKIEISGWETVVRDVIKQQPVDQNFPTSFIWLSHYMHWVSENLELAAFLPAFNEGMSMVHALDQAVLPTTEYL